MKKLIVLINLLILAVTIPAFAHGSLVKYAKFKDIQALFGEGVTLDIIQMKPFENNPYRKGKGLALWSKAVDKNGNVKGYVGMENISTEHGGLMQATCFEAESHRVFNVVVMQATPEEIGTLKKLTGKKEWWRSPAPEKTSDNATIALRRSVARITAQFINAGVK